jgi:hypothetical protein
VPITLWEPQAKPLLEMAAVINKGVQEVRAHKNVEHKDMTKLANYIPTYITGPLQHVASYLS